MQIIYLFLCIGTLRTVLFQGGGDCNTPFLTMFALKGIWCNNVINHGMELKEKAPPWISILCFGDWRRYRWYFVLAMHIKMLDIMCVCKINQKPTTKYVNATIMKRAWFPKVKGGGDCLTHGSHWGIAKCQEVNPSRCQPSFLYYSPFSLLSHLPTKLIQQELVGGSYCLGKTSAWKTSI